MIKMMIIDSAHRDGMEWNGNSKVVLIQREHEPTAITTTTNTETKSIAIKAQASKQATILAWLRVGVSVSTCRDDGVE